MGLFVQQNQERTALQERLEAELQEKVRQRALLDNDEQDIEKSPYLKGTKRTTSLAWVWIVVVALVVAAVVFLMMKAGGQL